jgi:type II secretory pathway pseudopilin PulG
LSLRLEDAEVRTRSGGFTLTEIAIVLLIAGLLLGSVISTVSTQLDARNIRETQTRLDQVKDALTGFAQATGRLPCPADGTIASGAANAGREVYTVTVAGPPDTQQYVCTNANGFGVVPWATLGVSETDVWGGRFSYKVSPEFSDSMVQTTATWGCGATIPVPTPTQSSFALCAQGTLTVTTRTAASKTGSGVASVPVVVISHGKNGYGAYTSGGTQYTTPPAGIDEPANATAASTTFYSRELSPQTSPCSDTAAGNFCEFDDLVAYIPVNLLIARMVSAGKLP